MLLGVDNDRAFQTLLDEQENTLYRAIRPPLAHASRLLLSRGAYNARTYLIERGGPILFAHYRRIYRAAWRSIEPPRETRAAGEGMDDFLYEQLGWLDEEGGQKITGIADNLVQDIIDTIQTRVADGKSNAVIAREIYDEIPELTSTRAATIARTETHQSALAAIEETIQGKGFDTEEMTKTWWSVDDERVRPSHRLVHGMTVLFSQPFEVGGSLMMRPGDDSLGAGAEERVNCRCSILYNVAGAVAGSVFG